jgi:hypothetical protein
MSQSTRFEVARKLQDFGKSDGLLFHDVLDPALIKAAMDAEGVKFNKSLYTPMTTLCLFLSQVLDPDHSCRAAVARLVLWVAIRGRKPCSAETGTYCDARRRLPLGVVMRVVRQHACDVENEAADGWLWKGRRVAMVDGSTLSMPDTPENQEAFPQMEAQKPGLGFPLVRIVAIIALATGVARDLALGPYSGKETGETALFRMLWDGLQPGEIVLGDRFFASFFGIAGLSQRNVDALFRMHQRRKYDFRRGRCLGVEDHVVAWVKPARPEWMDEATCQSMPDTLEVRELRVKVDRQGYRVDELILVTTLLDAAVYTKEDVANLYLQRWNIELDLRSIKDVMQMDILRCKTPEMVEKEIWMHLLAYNLIRGVMARAGAAHGVAPRLVSFKGTLQTMAAFGDALHFASPQVCLLLLERMLAAIASHRVGGRPSRTEPRAVKRRPKPHRYLTEPRTAARNRLLVRN